MNTAVLCGTLTKAEIDDNDDNEDDGFRHLGLFTLDGHEPIRYMKEGSIITDDIITLSIIPNGSVVIADPTNINETLEITKKTCKKHEDHLDCTVISDDRVELIKTLRYEIYHYGAKGIREIDALVEFKTLDLKVPTEISYRPFLVEKRNFETYFGSDATSKIKR